ncbi:hypothetical protein [Alteromonas naphthalenivorans]|uniref:Uncharacterized protein n=1 Tax=Alteromonas naphthalenivorans TaxID=715451 RepID=F5Z5F0_ALTNA|nr:hypothetical protein [Alteromonas naphthalenivorans]AEF04876.1 hypothetical protein ambt_16855 [Alteromonas naphthalenivorans]
MGRHNLSKDEWLAYGKDLIECSSITIDDKDHKLAVENIAEQLSYLDSDKDEAKFDIDAVKHWIDSLNKKSWERFKSRIRSKRYSQDRTRITIQEKAQEYLSIKADEFDEINTSVLVNLLGEKYQIVDASLLKSLFSLKDKLLPRDKNISLREFISYMESAADNKHVISLPRLALHVRGADIDPEKEYVFAVINPIEDGSIKRVKEELRPISDGKVSFLVE